jgi:hypothetical protein
MSKLYKVISGGQTGADRGALIAAKKYGLQTGGYMPKGFKAQDGYKPEFATLYNMQETEKPTYPPRTILNVMNSDGTLRIASDFYSSGELFTLRMIEQYSKPYKDVNPMLGEHEQQVKSCIEWIDKNDIRILNVAGNSERTSPGIEEFATEFMSYLFDLILER